MGVPSGGGTQLGNAVGRVIIDTSDLRRAQNEVVSASRVMTQALGSLGVGVGVRQFAQFAIEATALATAYERQRVAAVNLAGSQSQLNELLETYEAAVGGSVSQIEALENVTKLLSVGFADSASELDQFARAIRGISLALGRSEDFVTQNLILELFSQRGQRLDQLGLQYDKVRQRADELRAADRSLTQQMAYQQAVLEQADDRFGKLADSAAGQRTEVEKLTDAWKDLRLEMGRTLQPTVEGGAGFFRSVLDFFTRRVKETNDLLDAYEAEWVGRFGQRTTIGRVTPTRMETAGGFTPDQTTAIVEWSRAVQEIERQANADRLAATRQYEQQRSDTIRHYETAIAREAEDFARQRARAEEDYQQSLFTFRRDIATRERRQAEDLALQVERARTDNTARLLELESDYNRARERAARDHSERILDAAGRLDAKAIAEAQREFAKRQRDAEEDHEERRRDERVSLERSLRQAQEAADLQLRRAREDDEQRLTDMVAAFEQQRAREDEDRRIAIDRRAADFQAQLDELAEQHENRLIQIADHAQEERTLLDEEFGKSLEALGIRVDKYILESERATGAAIDNFNRWLEAVNNAFMGPMEGPQPQHPLITPGRFPSLTPSAVAPQSWVNNSRASNVVVHPGAIVVQTQPGMNEEFVGQIVLEKLTDFLEEIAN